MAEKFNDISPVAAVYDGDTTAWHRKKIRDNLPNVILTNPEMIHLSFLPYHDKWQKLFNDISLVVVDRTPEGEFVDEFKRLATQNGFLDPM